MYLSCCERTDWVCQKSVWCNLSKWEDPVLGSTWVAFSLSGWNIQELDASEPLQPAGQRVHMLVSNLDFSTGFPSKGKQIFEGEKQKTKMRQFLLKSAKSTWKHFRKTAAYWVLCTFRFFFVRKASNRGNEDKKPNLSSSARWSEQILFGLQSNKRLKLWAKDTLMFFTWLPFYIATNKGRLRLVGPGLKSLLSHISASVPILKCHFVSIRGSDSLTSVIYQERLSRPSSSALDFIYSSSIKDF